MRRRITNAFLVALVACLLIDGLPSYSRWQDGLKEAIDPLLDVTGLWQGTWDLFAPEIDRQNNGIVVTGVTHDAESLRWTSPRWKELPWTSRFWSMREIEFFDRIRSDANRAAWDSFARYAKVQFVELGEVTAPEEIAQWELRRYWQLVPPPRSNGPIELHEEVFLQGPGPPSLP